MGRWEDEMMGKRENERMRKRDNGRIGRRENRGVRGDFLSFMIYLSLPTCPRCNIFV